jgi:hypothetical protein
VTATGMQITIRTRSSKQTLRRVLGGRAPKLIVGRSKFATSQPGDRLNVLWTAKRKG